MIWFAEEIVTQQLICVRRPLNFFDQLTERMSRMSEMRRVAMIRENSEEENHRRAESYND